MEEDAAAKEGSLAGPGSTQDARALQHEEEEYFLNALEPVADARARVSVQQQPAGFQAQGGASGLGGVAAPSAADAEQPCEEAAPGLVEPAAGSGAAHEQAAAPGNAADIAVGNLAQRLRGTASQSRSANLQAEPLSAPEVAPGPAGQQQPAALSVQAQQSAAAPDRAAGAAAAQPEPSEAPHTQPTSLATSAAASLAEGAAQPDIGEATHAQPTSLAASAAASLVEGAAQPDPGEDPHTQPTSLAADAAVSLAEGACQDVPVGTTQPTAGVYDTSVSSSAAQMRSTGQQR